MHQPHPKLMSFSVMPGQMHGDAEDFANLKPDMLCSPVLRYTKSCLDSC